MWKLVPGGMLVYLLFMIGASLSETHTYVMYGKFVCLSVCLSFFPYVHGPIIYNYSKIYGLPFLLIAVFEAVFVCIALHSIV